MSATARILRYGNQAVQEAMDDETTLDMPGLRDIAHPPISRVQALRREILEEEPDPIFRVGESEDTERWDHRGAQQTSPKPKPRTRSGKRW